MEFLDFEPIFGEPMVEWPIQSSHPLRKFVLYVHTPEPSRLRFIVSDFLSDTWEASRTVHQLEDMRDSIGIGGSWSDFVDYVRASMKSTDVKLVVESSSNSSGTAYARLVAQKTKGMPRISIPLVKLVDAAATTEAIATLSSQLFETFKSTQNLLVEEQECSKQLKKALSDQKEKNESIQSQLEVYSKRQKLQSDKTDVSAPPGNGLQNSPDKPTGRPNRVVPAHRRARVRGVLLQNSDDDNDE